jgi:hypothetical protein
VFGECLDELGSCQASGFSLGPIRALVEELQPGIEEWRHGFDVFKCHPERCARDWRDAESSRYVEGRRAREAESHGPVEALGDGIDLRSFKRVRELDRVCAVSDGRGFSGVGERIGLREDSGIHERVERDLESLANNAREAHAREHEASPSTKGDRKLNVPRHDTQVNDFSSSHLSILLF